jgi:peptide/nickel transport system substrate-binding protein
VITPGNAGYRKFNLYPSPGNHGNAAKAKQLLAKAGYGKGVTLKLLYDDADPDPQIAQVIQSSLGKAGIKVDLKQVPQSDLYGNFLVSPAQAKQGAWDLAIVDWGPDWFGNNGRTTIQPLLDGSTYGAGSSDYGDYYSKAESAFIAKALAAASPATANAAWHAADLRAMKDAAIVPLDVHEHAVYHASSVHGWFIDPYSRVGDVTDVWLS